MTAWIVLVKVNPVVRVSLLSLSKLYIDVNKFIIEKIIKKETGRIMDAFGLPILSCSDFIFI